MASPLHPIGWRWTFAICVASACVGAGCWTASAARTAAAPIVTVTAGKPSEFAFTLSKSSGLPAVVSFSVTNRGALAHAFKVAGAATRVLAPGQSTILTVSFARPGIYEYRSSVPGQAAKGMRGRLVVAPAAVKPAAPSTRHHAAPDGPGRSNAVPGCPARSRGGARGGCRPRPTKGQPVW